MESNNLIAKFMGLEYAPEGSRWDDWFDKDRYRVTYGNRIPLQYHTSWDWLMPVVNKCMQTGDNTDEWDALCDALSTVNITNTYDAVVEFIKKYNDGIN